MTLPNLISFSGYAFAGKDTLADLLVENDGYAKTYMSKPLEKALLTLNPLIPLMNGLVVAYSALHADVGYDESKKNPEVRRLLQLLGTEIGREMFDQNVWVNIAENEIHELWSTGTPVTITGVRYPNEMAMVRQNGGVTIWIERPGYKPVNSHTSDNTLGPDDCDLHLVNNSTPEAMYDCLFPILLNWRP